MRLKKRYKICILLMAILVISIFVRGINDVSAAINNYGTDYSVDSEGLDDAMKNSQLLNLLGRLVYAVGRLLEWILGTIFETITNGKADFPWADKIVFNAVPLLDVNFINPDSESYLGNSAVKSAISNTYATVFSISLSFFTIFVMISAIKLAISTIADQKAKYKKALMDWALGLVMLFTMHYFISFIFYLNEQLVQVAQKIYSTQLTSAVVKVEIQASELSEKLLESIRDFGSPYDGYADYLEQHKSMVSVWINTLNSDDSHQGIHNITKNKKMFWDSSITDVEQAQNLYNVIKWTKETCPSVAELQGLQKKAFISKEPGAPIMGVVSYDFRSCMTYDNYDALKLSSLKSTLAGNVLEVIDSSYNTSMEIYDKPAGSKVTDVTKYDLVAGEPIKKSEKNWDFSSVIGDLIILKKASDNEDSVVAGGGGGGLNNSVITDLATYFKQTSFDMKIRGTDVTGATKDKKNVNLSNAILYAVLVAQSLILFIAYIKRLFYVVMLGLISPAVVAYDFFKRFGK